MSKPYQTETYDIDDDTKEYINLFSLGVSNTLQTVSSGVITFTIGTDAYDNDPTTMTGKFSNVNKTSSINYSNGIITINKSGNYRLNFNAIVYFEHSRAPLFFVKKNGITIAEIAIQVTKNTSSANDLIESFMFLTPIFSVNTGDNIRIDVTIDDNVGVILNQNVFLQEI
jgi:hypothetical protein